MAENKIMAESGEDNEIGDEYDDYDGVDEETERNEDRAFWECEVLDNNTRYVLETEIDEQEGNYEHMMMPGRDEWSQPQRKFVIGKKKVCKWTSTGQHTNRGGRL